MGFMGRTSFLVGALLCLLGFFANATAAVDLPDLVPLVKQLKPVVVNISTTQTLSSGKDRLSPDQFKNTPFDEFFRRFFERLPQGSRKTRSLGSGVIVDASGYILTNSHVVAKADGIQVRLSDDREFEAGVVGLDEKTDLALIRIKNAGALPVARLGDSDGAEVGSWVLAIGNPFGLQATVTAGIISAKGRVIGNGPYDNFLQTDAAINPGNSGGPLFNLDGAVIGINTAIFSRSGGNMGIGFAIPVNMAKSIMAQLKSHGRVTRGWLGVRIQIVTNELAQALALGKRRGALVASIEEGSPADKAGVKTGDVIVRFDGHEVGRMKELPAIVADTPVDKKVDMVVIRDGKSENLTVVVAEMKEIPAISTVGKSQADSLGLTVKKLTPALRERLKLDKETDGVVVTSVESGSGASEAGIRIGDLIAEINRKPIRKLSDFRLAVRKVAPGKTLLVLLIRKGDPLYLALKVPKKK